jgi:hypothetical protein
MKKTLTLIIICLIAFKASAQKQIFESPNLKTAIKTQKTVAILPFVVSITYKKQPKGYDPAANKAEELKSGKSIQASMYTYLLRRVNDYTVTFQDVEKTNILLLKNKLLDSLDYHTKDEIAKILGVDAVIYGSYSQATTRSEAGAIVTTALFGFGGKTGNGIITMQIANGTDGETLWRYTKSMNEGLLTSTDDVIESQMRKVSRNFPYMK